MVRVLACQCVWYIFLLVNVCGTFSCVSMCVLRFLACQYVWYIFLRVSMCGTFSCVSVCVMHFLVCQYVWYVFVRVSVCGYIFLRLMDDQCGFGHKSNEIDSA